MNKKNKKIKQRNYIAIAAHFKTGAGYHTDRKKEESRMKCRKKIKNIHNSKEGYNE